MLGIRKDRVPSKMSHDVGMQDMLHDLVANGSQRYWSVVGNLGLVIFIEDDVIYTKVCQNHYQNDFKGSSPPPHILENSPRAMTSAVGFFTCKSKQYLL
jgi:hypothetical protein